jgi:hypothetical protein
VRQQCWRVQKTEKDALAISINHLPGAYKTAAFADKIKRMNYDIHVGAVLGLPGKIMAFLRA